MSEAGYVSADCAGCHAECATRLIGASRRWDIRPSAKAAYRYQAVVRRSWRQHVDGVLEVRTLHDGVVLNRQQIAVKHAGGPP